LKHEVREGICLGYTFRGISHAFAEYDGCGEGDGAYVVVGSVSERGVCPRILSL
jgi:hypothetical protein